MLKVIDKILSEIEDSITTDQFKHIESERIELKSFSFEGNVKWDSVMETVCSFLNTEGGIIIMGIHEDRIKKKYEIKGFNFDHESSLKSALKQFKDELNHSKDISGYVHFEQKELLSKKLNVLYVESLPGDEKYAFFKEKAYERVMEGDELISKLRIEAQSDYKKDLKDTREIRPVINASIDDLDLGKLNYYIQLSNAEYQVQEIIPTINDAIPFLTINGMFKEDKPTILGLLVCGKNPGVFLGFKSQVDAYVEMPIDLPVNKKVINDNVIALLEQSTAFVFRNIQTGISVEKGGTKTFEYPEELIRECINNSLAHRDYTIDQFVNINILPSKHIQIKNPGRFKPELLIIDDRSEIPIKRIVPNNPKANNPKLAKVLNVFNKWEGKGWGMKRLITACLDGDIDLPYYVFHSWEVLSLYIPKGDLVDKYMESFFEAHSKYIYDKLDGSELTHEQKRVFAYFFKSEVANRNERFTLLLTKNNNHLQAISSLEDAGLIYKHPKSNELYSVYIVDRVFFKKNYYAELKSMFGQAFIDLPPEYKELLNTIYLFKNFSLKNKISANLISNFLYYKENPNNVDLHHYDTFKRKVRYQFNKLESQGFLSSLKKKTQKGNMRTDDYSLNKEFRKHDNLFNGNSI